MLNRLAAFIVRRGRIVLLAALVATIAAGAIGGGVASHLSSGGFFDPSAPSSKAHDLLASQFHTGDPNLVLLLTAKRALGSASGAPAVDDPAIGRAALALTDQLSREPHIGADQVSSYWSLGGPPPWRSKDGTQALILALEALSPAG